MLRHTISLPPCPALGPAGEGYLRLCFASSPERLAEALERLKPVLG
jgi:aspartate aminotransferase